jgi:tripeptidyl-peptidase-1
MANLLAIDGKFDPVFGTSASAPVIASMITLINDARITAGKSSIGFINTAVCFSSFRR